MPIIDLTELQTLAANYADRSVNLSANTQALFYCMFQYADPLYNWQGAGYTLTDSEIDTIKALVALAYNELMEAFTLNTKTILAPIVLYELTLSSADGFYVDLDAIDDYADCEQLEIYLHIRGLESGSVAFLKCFLNGDGTESHYDNSRVVNTTTLVGQNNAGKPYAGAVTATTAPSNLFTDVKLWINKPHSSHIKNVASHAATTSSTTAATTEINTMTWNDTSAITSVEFQANLSPLAGFAVGSSIRVIGYKEVTVYTP